MLEARAGYLWKTYTGKFPAPKATYKMCNRTRNVLNHIHSPLLRSFLVNIQKTTWVPVLLLPLASMLRRWRI